MSTFDINKAVPSGDSEADARAWLDSLPRGRISDSCSVTGYPISTCRCNRCHRAREEAARRYINGDFR